MGPRLILPEPYSSGRIVRIGLGTPPRGGTGFINLPVGLVDTVSLASWVDVSRGASDAGSAAC